MDVKEIPVVFECEGVSLIGIIHLPERARNTGLLTVAAGGIQYRAGCGRQLVTLARALASKGTPVMRFDNRGMGDSVGDLLGFQHMEKDLKRALEVFQEQVPELKQFVLYGGCEAASAIMINACSLPRVKSVMLANPWVYSDFTQALVSRNHYTQRIKDPQFWKKLLTFQYDLSEYVVSFFSYVKKVCAKVISSKSTISAEAGDIAVPYQERMLSGLEKFTGPVLFLKSGLSFVSEEFDQLVASSKPWQSACGRSGIERVELPLADQTLSTAAARSDFCKAAVAWLTEINKLDDTPTL